MIGTRALLGLDVGSTKTCAVLVEATPGRNGAGEPEPLRVLGIGVVPTSGLQAGVVTNLEATTESILEAAREAELVAGREVESAYVGVPGLHAEVACSSGIVVVEGKEIDEADVRRVEEVGRTVALDPGREILHAIPQEYLVDGRRGIQDPIGMTATRLEAEICIVTAATAACLELRKAVDRAGYRPEELVLEPLASSLAVLDDRERRQGVALVELGGSRTDLVVFRSERIERVRSFPWGSATVTSDISKGLGVLPEEAARLKERYGCALRRAVDPAEELEVPGPGGGPPRRIARELLAHIIEQRLDEILGLVYDDLERTGLLAGLGAGIVLTGGGASLPGTVELARGVFNLPVRAGEPSAGLVGLGDAVRRPSYATSVGLALYGSAREPSGGFVTASRVLSGLGAWLKDFF